MGEDVRSIDVVSGIRRTNGRSRGCSEASDCVRKCPDMIGAAVEIERVGRQLGIPGHYLDSALGHAAKLDSAFGYQVRKLLDLFRYLVEEFMEIEKVGSFDIPVGLLRLQSQVKSVGELPVQQSNGCSADALWQIITGEFETHKKSEVMRPYLERTLENLYRSNPKGIPAASAENDENGVATGRQGRRKFR
jgi:hypothetical protein